MAARRGRTRDLCSGPGRLCQALGITGEFDWHPLDQAPLRLIPREPVPSGQVGSSPPDRRNPGARARAAASSSRTVLTFPGAQAGHDERTELDFASSHRARDRAGHMEPAGLCVARGRRLARLDDSGGLEPARRDRHRDRADRGRAGGSRERQGDPVHAGHRRDDLDAGGGGRRARFRALDREQALGHQRTPRPVSGVDHRHRDLRRVQHHRTCGRRGVAAALRPLPYFAREAGLHRRLHLRAHLHPHPAERLGSHDPGGS